MALEFNDETGEWFSREGNETPRDAFGNEIKANTSGDSGSGIADFLKNIPDWAKALGAFGISAAARNSSFFNPPVAKVGFQGTIPTYTATREQKPYASGITNELLRIKQAATDAIGTGATPSQVQQAAFQKFGISPTQFAQAMQTQGEYRRPGAGGIEYFSPIQYVQGTAPGTPGEGEGDGTPPTPARAPYSGQRIAQGIYDVLNPAGGGLGTLKQAREGAAKLGVGAAQFDEALIPRLAQAIQEAKAQMPTATIDQIRDAAMRRYGIDADIFNKAAGTALPTNAAIKSEIQAIIDKPQEVAWLANTYGLNIKELADITGFTEDQVKSYFANNNVPLPTSQAAAGGQMDGGIAMLSKGRYLKGNGDGVSDSIPAQFADSGRPAALADGEFVVPARVVSELGNGSSDAGARKLYAMLDRVERRAKAAKRGKPSGADKELNRLA
jgi:hypothetical protein